jgi:hypothetical protein
VASGAGQRRTTQFQRIYGHVRDLGGRNRPAQSNSTAKSVLEPFSRRARRPQVHVERECPDRANSRFPIRENGRLVIDQGKQTPPPPCTSAQCTMHMHHVCLGALAVYLSWHLLRRAALADSALCPVGAARPHLAPHKTVQLVHALEITAAAACIAGSSCY